MRIALISSFLLAATCAEAQTAEEMLASIDLSTPEAAVFSMMRAMYQGDAEMVDQIFLDTASLRRITYEGEIRPDGLQNWRNWVGTLDVGAAHERLFGVESQQFGKLATVWAPFTIHLNGDLVGCGVNTMTLTEQDGAWRVIYGMDTNMPKDTCDDFQAQYSNDG